MKVELDSAHMQCVGSHAPEIRDGGASHDHMPLSRPGAARFGRHRFQHFTDGRAGKAGRDVRSFSCLLVAQRKKNMKTLQPYFSKLAVGLALGLAVVLVGTLSGCSNFNKAADVAGSVRTSMEEAGLKSVTVTQDRDKGVVTLGGHVETDHDKDKAESIARSLSGPQVVSNQIAVLPLGVENEAHKVNVDLDEGIESNLDAALIAGRLHDSVKYTVKNHAVTLTGEVNSQSKRARAEEVAAGVLNVAQVVNELQVKKQKATSSN